MLKAFDTMDGALGLTKSELTRLARNSIEASFLPADAKLAWAARIDAVTASC